MATFVADTVDDSALDYSNTFVTKTRGGVVTGLSGDPGTALEQCIDAAEAAGHPMGESITVKGKTLLLSRLAAKPFSADSARCQLIYSNDWGASPQAYIVTVDNYEQSYQTDLLPGTRIPLWIDAWTDGIPGVLTGDPANTVAGDNFTCVLTRTITEVSISGIKAGSETPEYRQSVNRVNASPWYGYPRGWWKVTRGQTSLSKYTGYFSFIIAASARNDEDWSEFGVLVNKATGRKVNISETQLAAAIAADYKFGGIAQFNGGIRFGPYHVLDFSTIFPSL